MFCFYCLPYVTGRLVLFCIVCTVVHISVIELGIVLGVSKFQVRQVLRA